MQKSVLRTCVACCLLSPLSAVGGDGSELSSGAGASVWEADARPDPAWDVVFTRREGWTGGDAAYSVDLGDGRTLWLFADTWIGSVAEGKHVAGSRLVNNTVAVHPTPVGGRPPACDAVRFYWGPPDAKGRPTAWITPDPQRVGAGGDAIQKEGGRSWYWVADGIVAPGPTGRARLLIFLWHIGRRDGGKGVWNFKSVGGALAVIDNPGDPVEKWRVRQFDNPHTIDADAAAANVGVHELSWGSEVLAVPAADGRGGADLYIYGVREVGGANKEMVLARAPAGSVERFDTWRFRTAKGWSARLADAVAMADGVANEFSVDRVMINGRGIWVMVHSEPLLGPRILMRTAVRPEGPWSKPHPVFNVPGVAKNKSYFTYAAKGHGHLSRPGELLVTYVVNSLDFAAMVRDAEIYRPRFVRVPVDWLPVPE